LLALMHGQFSTAMLVFLELRSRNVASPFAAVEMCTVMTGLLVLSKATSYGQDLLPIVREIDTYDWNLPTGWTRPKQDQQRGYLSKARRFRLGLSRFEPRGAD
jgi:hypothetical protein